VVPLDEICEAAERARPHVQRTPLVPAGSAGSWLKLELLQPTGSFKVRGFAAAALALTPDRRRRGLLTVSAGNAALACAWVARWLEVPCRVVMLETAPPPKVEGVRALGGEPRLVSRGQLQEWMAGRGWEAEPEAFLHPFADGAVQAGHGGIGLELVEQLPEVGRVVVPVGGGGLVAGVASAVKALRSGVEVVGVQSDGYPLWVRAIADGGASAITPRTIADGTTAPYEPAMHELLGECVDTWLAVRGPARRRAVPALAAAGKVVAEGSGALAYAALALLPEGPPTVAVVSGGNLAPRLLATLLREDA